MNTILVSALVTARVRTDKLPGAGIRLRPVDGAGGLGLVINWAMISLAHMKFRRAKQQQGSPLASCPLLPVG
ncbi:hypothetical protein LNP25_12830 [Klebsiella variicola subsp. variicola]|nr:hypothetical protein [Klebsiella variicola subsp. variicola]